MAHPQIRDRFRNSVISALAKFKETAGLGHAGLKGRFREIFAADLLNQVLSNDFVAGSGVVVDHAGGISPEADIIIFDRFHAPAVLYSTRDGLFPLEGVCYYGEVKSELNRATLLDSIEKFRKLQQLRPLPNFQDQTFWPPRFIFAWSSDLTGGRIEKELDRYIDCDGLALTDPAATILCVAGKGYCCVIRGQDGMNAWYRIGETDGVQEVVNFIGGVANSVIDFRMQRFGTKFAHYIIPFANSVKLRELNKSDNPQTAELIKLAPSP
jgi:hypothetical protein